ncbi:hypothetical protein ACCO45_013518 [Purpureocillium lilacinum]|uniref:Uncharacterized protein n=1 Tax=Purpureocillium lilacinum TaxID=33203 RepID=A0ACC4D6G5_PURLI
MLWPQGGYALQFFPPFETDVSRDPALWHRTFGIDCLVQLLRHIVSHADDVHKAIKALLEEEPGNPILFHALQTLHRNKPWPDNDQVAAATDSKVSLLEQVADPTRGLAAYTINTLCTSPLMNETFWSRNGTQLFAKVLVQDLSHWAMARQEPEPFGSRTLGRH